MEKVSGMRLFAELAIKLGTSTKTNERLELLVSYFSAAADADKVWMIALFSGRRPKRTVNTTLLWEWCREMTGLPGWLFAESYHVVGDLAETIALLLPEANKDDLGESLGYYLIRLGELGKEDEAARKEFVQRCWAGMNQEERFVFNKLITGGFRIGISQQTVVNALAKATGAEASVVAHRISGDWDPASTEYTALISGTGGGERAVETVSFLSRLCAGGSASGVGQAGGMAGGMEVGWDPGSVGPARRFVVCVEPRRRTDDGEVSRIQGIFVAACSGDGARWGDHRV